MDKLLRLTDVEKRVALKRTAIYRWIALGDFPKPVRMGPRSSRWRESAISDWIETLKTAD